MLLQNNSNVNLQHSYEENGKIKLLSFKRNEVKEIDDKVAEKWLKIDGVKEFVNPSEVKNEIQDLKEQLAEALARAEKAEAKIKKAKKGK